MSSMDYPSKDAQGQAFGKTTSNSHRQDLYREIDSLRAEVDELKQESDAADRGRKLLDKARLFWMVRSERAEAQNKVLSEALERAIREHCATVASMSLDKLVEADHELSIALYEKADNGLIFELKQALSTTGEDNNVSE